MVSCMDTCPLATRVSWSPGYCVLISGCLAESVVSDGVTVEHAGVCVSVSIESTVSGICTVVSPVSAALLLAVATLSPSLSISTTISPHRSLRTRPR